MTLAFPKPKEIKRLIVPIRVHLDGREVCCKAYTAGCAEYRRRTLEMLARQGGRCCLEAYAPMCTGVLSEDDATFEHERSRGGGKRDDRTELPNGTWINGAAHRLCNAWKGSRFIDYNRGFQR